METAVSMVSEAIVPESCQIVMPSVRSKAFSLALALQNIPQQGHKSHAQLPIDDDGVEVHLVCSVQNPTHCPAVLCIELPANATLVHGSVPL